MNYYVGNSLQTRGAEEYTLQNGKGNGMHFLYIRNGLGIEAWISLDRGGDISRVSFKGDNMGYFSPCGYVAPQYYDGVGAGFLKSFTAGFFTTCGLTAVGSPCKDEGEDLSLHGTFSHIPAEIYSIIEGEEAIEISLKIRDCRIFGRKLVMDRKYTFSYTDNSIKVSDTVTNEADVESPYMILYHCNMGYPLLDETSEVVIPNSSIISRNEHAENFKSEALKMEKPQSGYEECCYYYDVVEKNKISKVGIYNERINKGLVVLYNKNQLPCFTEWKMMGKTDYVLGLEPGNCTPDGRDVLRKNRTLKFLQPEESGTTELEFVLLDNKTKFKGEF
jgi:hypothetical protein